MLDLIEFDWFVGWLIGGLFYELSWLIWWVVALISFCCGYWVSVRVYYCCLCSLGLCLLLVVFEIVIFGLWLLCVRRITCFEGVVLLLVWGYFVFDECLSLLTGC